MYFYIIMGHNFRLTFFKLSMDKLISRCVFYQLQQIGNIRYVMWNTVIY